MPAASVVVGKSATDIKVQTEVEVYPHILTAVQGFLSAVESKVWLMTLAAMDARTRMGEGEEVEKQVRDMFRKAFAEEHKTNKNGKLDEDVVYRSNIQLAAKVVKVAFYYARKKLEEWHKQGKGFYSLYNKIPKANHNPTFAEHLKIKQHESDEPVSAGDVKGRFKDVSLDSNNKPLGVNKSAGEPPTSGWTDPDLAGKKRNQVYEGDDWRQESLDIIDDQFPRFLAMIKQALKAELTKTKRDELLALLS